MGYYIADLHIHSKYSRATSGHSDLDGLVHSAKLKGVNLLGTGDFTHTLWLAELEGKLEYKGEGIYHYRGVDFILTTEVSLIYSQAGRLRKVHIVLALPEIKYVKELNKELMKYGKLDSDGRPMLGMDIPTLMKIVVNTCEDAMVIPAHIWTPWFSLFGSNSGFDSIIEAFGDYAERITALETGLSSDPPMNWRLSCLDKYTLVSNSDAHSPDNVGREANVFAKEMNYFEIKKALETKDREKFLFTVEFFPEEGKYHYDGHRNCNVTLKPSETKKLNGICPVCGRPLTVGVLHRVEDLADREEGFVPENAIPYRRLVPLREIIAEAYSVGKGTKTVGNKYNDIVSTFGNEFHLLLEAPLKEVKRFLDPVVFQGIKNVREENLHIKPGYDGVYGVVKVFSEPVKQEKKIERRGLF